MEALAAFGRDQMLEVLPQIMENLTFLALCYTWPGDQGLWPGVWTFRRASVSSEGAKAGLETGMPKTDVHIAPVPEEEGMDILRANGMLW